MKKIFFLLIVGLLLNVSIFSTDEEAGKIKRKSSKNAAQAEKKQSSKEYILEISENDNYARNANENPKKISSEDKISILSAMFDHYSNGKILSIKTGSKQFLYAANAFFKEFKNQEDQTTLTEEVYKKIRESLDDANRSNLTPHEEMQKAIAEVERRKETGHSLLAAFARENPSEDNISMLSAMFDHYSNGKTLSIKAGSKQFLYAANAFFKEFKNQEDQTTLTIQVYNKVKGSLGRRNRSKLRSHEEMQKAIAEVERRKETGHSLLADFVSEIPSEDNISMLSAMFDHYSNGKTLSIKEGSKQFLYAANAFFKEFKNQEDQTTLTIQVYNKVKGSLDKTTQSSLRSYEEMQQAIEQVEDRKETGHSLLAAFARENSSEDNISMLSAMFDHYSNGEMLSIKAGSREFLYAANAFFKEFKNQEDQTTLTIQVYNKVKGSLDKTTQSKLRPYAQMQKAIAEVERRKETGHSLLEPYLGDKTSSVPISSEDKVSMLSAMFDHYCCNGKPLFIKTGSKPFLNAANAFFKEFKNQEDQKTLTEKIYDKIKSSLDKTTQSNLRPYAQMKWAIEEVERRKERGHLLLKPFLGRKQLANGDQNFEEEVDSDQNYQVEGVDSHQNYQVEGQSYKGYDDENYYFEM